MNKDLMKSLIVDVQGGLSLEMVPVPKPTDVQALVKVQACGVCNGTDGKLIHRAFKDVGLDQYPLILGA